MTLLVVFGPPAVGKMTVGRAIADASDFRLFHNHHTIEPLLDVFDYGTPPFNKLLGEFRQRVLEEAAAYGTDLVFTLVLDLEDERDLEGVRKHLAALRRRRPPDRVHRAGRRPRRAARPQPDGVPALGEEVQAQPRVVRRATCATWIAT